ncbi:MAG: DNA-directed RNA polymerase subunit alpha [Parcubacteria group bacterium RIFCSPLOWO2_01_FULL_48_18]|nr:MAG: DNA-directed RNA polymerase subunit alpha [Parcubacteria group bacterium RIFCSPLOWO2_01_FULL_48_18]OHB24051.1 MAG: DNA-directed RNA polymerase subunit alpha [Parcubacteria group bacterium RIFCSPHIGHO2_02_FULL_48_10b]
MLDISIVTKPKFIKRGKDVGVFEIENLYAGYGVTLGNALRRALLSSLPGAAVTQAKIKNVDHEFSTLPHVVEDMVEILLNLKKLRVKLHTEESQTLVLKAKGEQKVTAELFDKNSNAEVINNDLHIATLTDKKAELEMEVTVERGLGYEPVEARKMKKLPIGTLSLDAFFSPVKKVSFESENMRVGDRTDYNRLRILIETDGSISPSRALQNAAKILVGHFNLVVGIEAEEEVGGVAESVEEKKTKKAARGKRSAKKKK